VGIARPLVGGAFEKRVAETAIAAFEQTNALSDFRQIGDQCFAILFIDLCSGWHLHHGVFTIGAGPDFAFAAFAILGFHMLLKTVIDQRVEIIDRLDPDIAAAPAIAAIR